MRIMGIVFLFLMLASCFEFKADDKILRYSQIPGDSVFKNVKMPDVAVRYSSDSFLDKYEFISFSADEQNARFFCKYFMNPCKRSVDNPRNVISYGSDIDWWPKKISGKYELYEFSEPGVGTKRMAILFEDRNVRVIAYAIY